MKNPILEALAKKQAEEMVKKPEQSDRYDDINNAPIKHTNPILEALAKKRSRDKNKSNPAGNGLYDFLSLPSYTERPEQVSMVPSIIKPKAVKKWRFEDQTRKADANISTAAPAQWRQSPEYIKLLNAGNSWEDADRIMTLKGFNPELNIDEAQKPDNITLPSGTVLRKEDTKGPYADIDSFFRQEVVPGISLAEHEADRRYARTIAAPKDRSWGEAFKAALRSTPLGGEASAAQITQQAGTARRERGPARIINDVLSGIDPQKANEYIAAHLKDDPEFASVVSEMDKTGLNNDMRQLSDADMEKVVANMTPAQRIQYDKAVESEQRKLSGEQERMQNAFKGAWQREAEKFHNGIAERLIDKMAEQNMPKNELEAFARMAYNASIPGMLMDWAVGEIAADGSMNRQIMQRAMEKYGPSILTKIGSEAAGLLMGAPLFSVGGAFGKAGAAGLRKLAERRVVGALLKRGVADGASDIAKRIVGRSAMQQVGEAAVTSGAALGTYDAVSSPLSMAAAGETPELKNALSGAVRGFLTGSILPVIGRATARAADAATSSLGKYSAELGGFAAENAALVGMGTLFNGFTTGEWGSPEQLAEEFGHSIGVLGILKSVGALKRARERNRGFYDKVLSETEFTPEEVKELQRVGVDGQSYKKAIYDLLNAKQTVSGKEVATHAAETISDRYADIMQSDVSMTLKTKLMFLTEGRIPSRVPMTTDVRRSMGEDGRSVVELFDPAGNLVQRRTFDNEHSADVFERESAGLRNANTILYYDNAINELRSMTALDAATERYASESGIAPEVITAEVMKAAQGQSHNSELVGRVVELARPIRESYDDVPGIIADGLSLKYGLGDGGFDKALSLKESSRTPKQREAIAEYAAKLKEFATQHAEQTSATPEQRVERQLTEQAESMIADRMNQDNDVIYTATMQDGRDVNIIKGASIEYDPQTGEIDPYRSDMTVVVRYDDGSVRQVSVKDIDQIIEAVSTEDARSVAQDAIRSQLDVMRREEELTLAAEQGAIVELTDGRIGAIEGVNDDGTYNIAVQDADGRIALEQVVAGDIAGPVMGDQTADVASIQSDDPMLGRSLSEDEAIEAVNGMQNNAVPAPQLELTPENWYAQFGEDGMVQTPIGEVKMGENQYLKMLSNDQGRQFGMVKPTLANPDVIVEDVGEATAGATERASTYVFIKTFLKPDGQTIRYFTSVTVNRDGMDVVISNHLKNEKRINNLLKSGKLQYRVYGGPQTEQNRASASVTTSQAHPGVSDKDSATIPQLQPSDVEIPHKKDGTPDWKSMTSEQLAKVYADVNGYDIAVEDIGASRNSNIKKIAEIENRLSKEGDLDKRSALRKNMRSLQTEVQRLEQALDLLNAERDEVSPQRKRSNSDRIEELFPMGLPNVYTQTLADIARGQRFVWGDSPDGTKWGVARELGFTGNENERRQMIGITASPEKGGKYLSSYIDDLLMANNGYDLGLDDQDIRNAVIEALYEAPSAAAAMKKLEQIAVHNSNDVTMPRDAEDVIAKMEYEKAKNGLRDSKNNDIFAGEELISETDGAETTERNNDERRQADRRGISETGDSRTILGIGNRSDIRVFETGLGASYNEHPEYSTRDRREAESERLVAVAKANGLYIDPKLLERLGRKYPKRTGESVVYIDPSNERVYKIKNPYAKAAIKGNAPEDAIYEHIVHNLLFPESAYRFEGISEHLGDVRIVLSQNFVKADIQPTQAQIDAALAERGLRPDGKYSYGNGLVSVMDVEGDNVLVDHTGKLHFIDPIIKLKKPAREVIDALEENSFLGKNTEADLADVPFSVIGSQSAAPEGVTPERWGVIVDQLKRSVGAENVETDPGRVREAYEQIARRGGEVRMQRTDDANERFNSQLERLTPDNANSTILDLGNPSPEMLAVGIADKPLLLYGNKLLKKAKEHGYDPLSVRDLPRSIENPIAIFRGSNSGSFAILTEIKIGKNNILVTLKIGKGIDIDFNVVSSVYGKAYEKVVAWIKENKLLFANKKKTLNFLHYPAPIAETLKNSESVTVTNIVTNFENPKIEPENTAYFHTPDGEVYGFTTGGKIYLDSSRMNANTPMHEYTELWAQIVARENPELWARGAELMKHTLVWEDVNSDPNYKYLSEELRVSETLSRIVADEFTRKQSSITDSTALFGWLQSWMRKFWKFLKDTFTKWTKRELDDLTSIRFAKMPLRDFVEGIDLQKARGPILETPQVPGHKQMQADIIERYNPMRDDVHTGIRSVGDIKSFDEVVQDARQNGVMWPDMDLSMLDKAAKTGRITVYSSYPIKQGVFVSPSKINAQDYAVDGRVYKKVVPINNVAWIAQDEGMYAEVIDALDGSRAANAEKHILGYMDDVPFVRDLEFNEKNGSDGQPRVWEQVRDEKMRFLQGERRNLLENKSGNANFETEYTEWERRFGGFIEECVEDIVARYAPESDILCIKTTNDKNAYKKLAELFVENVTETDVEDVEIAVGDIIGNGNRAFAWQNTIIIPATVYNEASLARLTADVIHEAVHNVINRDVLSNQLNDIYNETLPDSKLMQDIDRNPEYADITPERKAGELVAYAIGRQAENPNGELWRYLDGKITLSELNDAMRSDIGTGAVALEVINSILKNISDNYDRFRYIQRTNEGQSASERGWNSEGIWRYGDYNKGEGISDTRDRGDSSGAILRDSETYGTAPGTDLSAGQNRSISETAGDRPVERVEAYRHSDPIADTYGEKGADAESDAHFRAVEDVVYDIVRNEGVEDVQVDVIQSPASLLEYARSNNWAKEDIEEIEQGILNPGYYSGGYVTILASLIESRKMGVGVFWHERTHGVTDAVCTPEQLRQAAEQSGMELLDRVLAERGYTSDRWSLERQADEYISRAVEILAKKQLLNDYLATPDADFGLIELYLAKRGVPGLLRDCIANDCKYIKNQKYGTEEGILLRTGDTDRAANIADNQTQSDRNNRTAVAADQRTDGGGDAALQRGFSGKERRSSSDDNERGVRANDEVGVRSQRGGDLEQQSTPKLTKQQQLVADLRRAVRESKASARSVAQLVSRSVREKIGREVVEAMGKREFDAVVRQIEQANIRQDIEKPLKRIAEIVTDIEIKQIQSRIDKFLQMKVQGENQRGVTIGKVVDDQTRQVFEIFRDNIGRPAEVVHEELENRDDMNFFTAMDGVDLLSMYNDTLMSRRDVQDIKREQSALIGQNTELRRQRIEANRAGNTSKFVELQEEIALNNELLDALDAERIKVKGYLLDMLRSTERSLSGLLGMGHEIFTDWQEQQDARRKEIVNAAFRDVGDGKKIPVLGEQPGVWTKRYHAVRDFLISPAYSMNYLLKMISVNAPKGEGALYDHFMRGEDGYVESRGKYWLGYEDFKHRLDEKVREIFGKSYSEVIADSNTPTDAEIKITNGRVKEVYSPTIGEALYMYMVDKMEDGRVKLRRMGIKEEQIDVLASSLPPQYIRFADWLQDEFLPERRKIYNQTHLDLFGAQMAQIENYVPLKVAKDYVRREVNGAEPDPDTLPTAITGSIIKRTRNRMILDLHTNVLDLILEHGQQMEHWNAFTHVVTDMNTLLSSTEFRRMLNARNPKLHGRLKVAAQLAADSYRPQSNDVNRMWIALGKLAASSKIAFRVNTAIKQVLSYPAFYSYSSDMKFFVALMKNLSPTKWAENWKWSLDNIPSFKERWLGRMAGNEKLSQMTAPMIDKWLGRMNKYGMLPNAFVDALTCANGAKAVYDFKRGKYIEHGKSDAEADRLAKIDAAVAINETQQSSEGMYIGQMQADRDFWSVSLSTFQNSNFAYLRKQLEGIDELYRETERERNNRAAYYQEQGFTDEEAFDMALKDVADAKKEAVLNILVFTFILNIVWALGNNVWKYLFAPESRREIPGQLGEAAMISAIRNTTVGSIAESFAGGYGANPSVLLSDMVAFTNRLTKVVEKENPDAWNETAAYIAMQTLTANGLGIDLESFVNMYQGVAGMMRDGYDVEDLMRMLNAPQSQAKLIAGRPKENETADQYAARMIFTERRIAERVGKRRRDKWTRNYTAYRQAEFLGMSAERDKFGVAIVPDLKRLDADYAEALKREGVTVSGNMRNDFDWTALTPEAQQRWRKMARAADDIRELQKQIDSAVVFNDAYKAQLTSLVELKRKYIEMANRD